MNQSCTPYHAIDSCVRILSSEGFTCLHETEAWDIQPGGKYYYTRNGTSVIAFTVGKDYVAGNGFTVVGAHSDSPCFRVKAAPCSVKADALVINTQPYGGGLWHTWFDRDLGIAGRVIARKADGSMEAKLVCIDRPVARIPNLAIHLTSAEERASFAPNLHEHCKAILSMDPSLVETTPLSNGFHPCLASMVAAACGLKSPEDIVDMDLQLIDLQPSVIGGAAEELVFSGRLDNLCSSYQCIRAICDAADECAANPSSGYHRNIQMAMIFDHEEVGSNSCQGAGSSMFTDTLSRIDSQLSTTSDSLLRAKRKSLVVSIDMAHAHHPNYPSKHDPCMAPKINRGLVVKHNANQRYATNSSTSVMFKEFANIAGLSMQDFSVRADMGCGSTIGPIIATLSGIPTVDVGSPQFSMHSIREMMGVEDVHTGYQHLKSAFMNHGDVAAKMVFE